MSASLTTISVHGLTEVFSPSNPQVDVVFVHGLNGHPYNTWTADNGVFWPRDLLPQQLGDLRCRILTYGYDANVSAFTDGVGKDHIHHHAENLAARLVANRSVCASRTTQGKTNLSQMNNAFERPIIFVVHSLGGLVTKQCLIYSRSIDHPSTEHLRSIYVSTYGILFMGTPHNGSDLAKWGTLLQSIASAALPRKFFDSSSHLVEALKTNNETLQNINRYFNEIMPRLKIYFFYEGRPMDLKGTRQFVVDEASAAPNFQGVERMGIERDHSHMCKFENEQSTGFAVVAEAVHRYSFDAPTLIAVRWEEEKQVRSFQRQMAAQELLAADRRSRNPSPDSRQNRTPLLDGSARTPILLENGAPTVTDWEVEEHDDLSRNPSSSRLTPRLPADTTNQSSPKSSAVPTPPASMSRSTNSLIVAPLGFRPNSHFVGFDIEMARLDKKLSDKRLAKIGVCSALLYGPPGCGKSHLAREYLWRHFEEYPNGVFWIDCKTPESLSKGFWNVAQSLRCIDEADTRHDAFIDAVRRHLTQRDKWLMVFDGISFENEDQLAAFVRYIPDGRGSSLIYTTVDRTLANRQRLLDPPGIKVYPLSVEQACSLLFKSLHLKEYRQPSATQLRKAKQLVKYYDCLPLGIHAAAHMLLARGRALERYTPGPSDNRLSEPFLQILAALGRAQANEAVDLLMITCFLNHQVPIALLQFGHNALLDFGLEIRALDPNGGGSRRELDNSIAILIKNGLVERRLQTSSTSSSGGRSSPDETRDHGIDRQNSGSLAHDFETHADHDGESQQSSPSFIGIDVIQVHTVVQNVFLDYLKANSQEKFNWWLAATARFLIASWNIAYDKMKANSGRGLVSDYREFESHVEKVWSHFPVRPEGVSQTLRQARHDLHGVRRMIKREIDNQSPSQSSAISGNVALVSVFERSGSSSDEGPATPTSGLTHVTSWSLEPNVDSTESPVEYHHPTFANLPVPLNDSWHEDGGYLSDTESPPPKHRTASNSTEKASLPRQVALRAIFEGRNAVEQWRATPVVGPVSAADVEPHHSRSNSASSMVRPISASSLAEAALSSLNRMGSAKGNQVPSPKGNERRPLSELSSNSMIANDSRPQPKTLSSSPHLVQAVLTSRLRRDPIPIEENISITRRIGVPLAIPGKPFNPNLPSLESHSLPSEHGPMPMLRDPSHESHISVQTEPPETSNSVKDEFVTPLMSPTVEEALYLSPGPRLSPINTATANTGLPYPSLNSPDTEPMPILNPGGARGSGLGISSQYQDKQ
ncbi:hypothetical protein H2198_007412 [Neophaeococcomyces mojaviensis]|uniref:Uncharacterized protein n=1 Tax=Neophaeococcomyces mojaviensis TaxID=3383035 RepID=A0ACC3A0B0_9EURO|nr:hypothetical protein H2198_007412 [Knufia sp. JES_112]